MRLVTLHAKPRLAAYTGLFTGAFVGVLVGRAVSRAVAEAIAYGWEVAS